MPKWESAPGDGVSALVQGHVDRRLRHVKLGVSGLELHRVEAKEGAVELDGGVEGGRVEGDMDLQVRGLDHLLLLGVDGREGRWSYGPAPGAALGVEEVDQGP